jgi:hypothetical protein
LAVESGGLIVVKGWGLAEQAPHPRPEGKGRKPDGLGSLLSVLRQMLISHERVEKERRLEP